MAKLWVSGFLSSFLEFRRGIHERQQREPFLDLVFVLNL